MSSIDYDDENHILHMCNGEWASIKLTPEEHYKMVKTKMKPHVMWDLITHPTPNKIDWSRVY